MTSRLHRAARREISEAAIFYAQRSQEIGDRFLDAVESAILKIRETPDRISATRAQPLPMPRCRISLCNHLHADQNGIDHSRRQTRSPKTGLLAE